MFASQHRDRFAGIDGNYESRTEVRREVDLAAGERAGGRWTGVNEHVANIGKAFGAQQLVGEVRGGNADARALRDPDRCGFEPSVFRLRMRQPDKPGGACRAERGKKAAPILRCLHEVFSANRGERHRAPPSNDVSPRRYKRYHIALADGERGRRNGDLTGCFDGRCDRSWSTAGAIINSR